MTELARDAVDEYLSRFGGPKEIILANERRERTRTARLKYP